MKEIENEEKVVLLINSGLEQKLNTLPVLKISQSYIPPDIGWWWITLEKEKPVFRADFNLNKQFNILQPISSEAFERFKEYTGLNERLPIETGAARVRNTVANENQDFEFTFKLRMYSNENLEVSQAVNTEFYQTMHKIRTHGLDKDRFLLEKPGLFKPWEIDCFKSSDYSTYFCMAELEKPPGVFEPAVIPEELEQYVLIRVEPTDKRFSSSKLSDEKYAVEQYQRLRENVFSEIRENRVKI